MNASTQHISDKSSAMHTALTNTSTPLRLINLKHFLDTALNTASNIEDIASIIERDPFIFSHFLRLNPNALDLMDCWYKEIETAMFPAVALSLTSDFLKQFSKRENTREHRLWMTSIRHSLLAEAVCKERDPENVTLARIAGLLSHIDEILATEIDPEQDITLSVDLSADTSQSIQQSADLLKSWGCSPVLCDAIRYQTFPVSELASTTPLLQAVAIGKRLVSLLEQTDTSENPDWQELETLGFTAEEGMNIINGVKQRFNMLYPLSLSHEQHYRELEGTFHDASLTAIYDTTVTHAGGEKQQKTVNNSAHFLFSMTDYYPMHLAGDELLVTLDNENLYVPATSENSLLARAYQTAEIQVLYPENCSSIQDNQLLERSNNEAIICVPLHNRSVVMLCSISRSAVEDALAKPQLLRNLCLNMAADQGAEIDKAPSIEQLELETEITERINKLIHEANNPFAVIQNYLHSLSFKLGQDSPLQKEIDIITAEISRTSEIISSFRDIGTRKTITTLENVNTNDVIQQLMSLIRESNQHIEFELDLDRSDCMVQSRPDDLKQILINLIKNAVECFEEFKPVAGKPTITVTTTHTINVNGKHYQEITIADNGPGIPIDIQQNLFRKKQTTKANGHFGLGLNIVVDLIEKIEAMITCKSKDADSGNHGTIFTLLIPRIDEEVQHTEEPQSA